MRTMSHQIENIHKEVDIIFFKGTKQEFCG